MRDMPTRLLAVTLATGALMFGASFGEASVSRVDDPAPGSVRGSIKCLERLKTRGQSKADDLVVYLVPLEDKNKKKVEPPSKPVVVEQKRLQFNPSVLPVLVGTTVKYTNEDRVKHNVFSDTDCCKVDLDAEPGNDCDYKFDKVGEALIRCRLHPDMLQTVLVLDTPHFTALELEKKKVDGDRVFVGEFEIGGLAPGKYRLVTWNRHLPAQEVEIEVASGAATTHDLVFEKLDD